MPNTRPSQDSPRGGIIEDAEEGDEGGDEDSASESGDDSDRADQKRVFLREIPEPEGLPHWCSYHGPAVSPR